MSQDKCTNDRQETPTPEKSSATPAAKSGPSQEEREGLICALRRQALQRFDPLVANLGMVSADLIAFAAQISRSVAQESPEGAITSSGFRAFEKKADLLLKVTRQIDRLASIQFQHMAKEDE
jgi:hypothetical protein